MHTDGSFVLANAATIGIIDMFISAASYPMAQILLQFPIDPAATISKLRQLGRGFPRRRGSTHNSRQLRNSVPSSRRNSRADLRGMGRGEGEEVKEKEEEGGAKRQQNFRRIWRTIDGASTWRRTWRLLPTIRLRRVLLRVPDDVCMKLQASLSANLVGANCDTAARYQGRGCVYARVHSRLVTRPPLDLNAIPIDAN